MSSYGLTAAEGVSWYQTSSQQLLPSYSTNTSDPLHNNHGAMVFKNEQGTPYTPYSDMSFTQSLDGRCLWWRQRLSAYALMGQANGSERHTNGPNSLPQDWSVQLDPSADTSQWHYNPGSEPNGPNATQAASWHYTVTYHENDARAASAAAHGWGTNFTQGFYNAINETEGSYKTARVTSQCTAGAETVLASTIKQYPTWNAVCSGSLLNLTASSPLIHWEVPSSDGNTLWNQDKTSGLRPLLPESGMSADIVFCMAGAAEPTWRISPDATLHWLDMYANGTGITVAGASHTQWTSP